jgi:AcrR family transcriptional regulator
MPKVTLEYKENTRDRILSSAKRLFEQKGYYETSMDDIVRSSHLSKGAIYGYFDSKESLFESLHDREFGTMIERAEVVVAGEGSASSKLERVADIYFLSKDEPSREQCRMAFQFSAASLQMKPVHGRLEDQRLRIHSLLASILKEGVRSGEFRKGIDTESIASLLVATVKGLTFLWATTETEIDWKKMRDVLVKTICDGITTR